VKLKRIAVLPFALVADAATLGNIGAPRSFTQQVFDAERQEQEAERDHAALRLLTDIVARARGDK
jgi:hypothetical protein